MSDSSLYKCVDQCGSAFYVYDADWHVVMTADAEMVDPAAGTVQVSVIWKQVGVKSGTPQYEAMVQAVRQRVIDGPVTLED